MEQITSQGLKNGLKDHDFVILDFSSPGCGPCRKVGPFLESLAEEVPETDLGLYEVDITREPDIAREYMVMGVPTIIVFRKGEELKRFSGLPGKKKILSLLTG